ncbi:MAG: acyl-CoA dehydrogenase family protein, partial [Gammaproteobacteria bacterium]
MSDYTPPLAEMRFVIERVCGCADLRDIPSYSELNSELLVAILHEAGTFATEILVPLNRVGDRDGARFVEGHVRMPVGWREAYSKFVDGGWNGLDFPTDCGGQGLPKVVATAVSEMWDTANLSFALGPMLTGGAAAAIQHHGSALQRARYLEHMVTGTWTGTMNLTEP